MQTRMKNPVFVIPEALKALRALDKSTAIESLPDVTRKLVHLRASQINGCSVCVDMHARELRERERRAFGLAVKRSLPPRSDREDAAIILPGTEAVTRIADRSDPVPDEVWNEAARHYDEATLAALVVQIGLINMFNRINAATRQMAGAAWN
jgi:AhpD family alkylhydroperoxidase